jgi:hypothetical protein
MWYYLGFEGRGHVMMGVQDQPRVEAWFYCPDRGFILDWGISWLPQVDRLTT